MDAIQVYALLNKKIKGLTSGIQSASISGTTITFTMNDGSTQNMVFPNPKSGASITDVNIKEISNEYHLICTITDADGNETEIDAGIIPNAKVQIASKTTAGIVKVGDNLEITSDGTLSAVGGGKPYEISKADYDALTEEERKDKVFYVYDDDEGYDGNNTELDTAMSDTSENGVQNKVIKAYVDDTIKEETTQIEAQLQDTIQESVEQAVSDAMSNSSGSDADAEIDSWF